MTHSKTFKDTIMIHTLKIEIINPLSGDGLGYGYGFGNVIESEDGDEYGDVIES